MWTLIYAPEDAERQQWDVDLNDLLSLETEPIEEVGGDTWDNFEDFESLLLNGNLKARRALLWILLRRSRPELRFVDLVVKRGEVDIEFDRKRLEGVRAEVLADTSISDEVRAARLAEVDARLTRIGVEPPVGKDEPEDSPTDSPSPPPVSPAE